MKKIINNKLANIYLEEDSETTQKDYSKQDFRYDYSDDIDKDYSFQDYGYEYMDDDLEERLTSIEQELYLAFNSLDTLAKEKNIKKVYLYKNKKINKRFLKEFSVNELHQKFIDALYKRLSKYLDKVKRIKLENGKLIKKGDSIFIKYKVVKPKPFTQKDF